jgi:hypothetical protein
MNKLIIESYPKSTSLINNCWHPSKTPQWLIWAWIFPALEQYCLVFLYVYVLSSLCARLSGGVCRGKGCVGVGIGRCSLYVRLGVGRASRRQTLGNGGGEWVRVVGVGKLATLELATELTTLNGGPNFKAFWTQIFGGSGALRSSGACMGAISLSADS